MQNITRKYLILEILDNLSRDTFTTEKNKDFVNIYK